MCVLSFSDDSFTVSQFSQRKRERERNMSEMKKMNEILFDHSKDAYVLSCQMVDAIEVRGQLVHTHTHIHIYKI